ncbi:Dynamin-related protein 4C [Platanthera zijinensis]|uniref:Dynamin-related protein 4C n=1 Tax=Platanthera zijinensis TaxID=2320716 RepID=A0AAP0AZ61_9ASPA
MQSLWAEARLEGGNAIVDRPHVGICTRVPLIMRLQDDPSRTTPLLHLEYQERVIKTSEEDITLAIEIATSEIAGSGKGISDTPLTLVRLMHIQAQSIARSFPNIVKKVNEKLTTSISELDGMPQNLVSVADAMRAFMQVISRAKDTLKKLLVRGEYEDYSDDNQMHGTARLAEMLNEYAKDLPADIPSKGGFLMEEIGILEEARGIGCSQMVTKRIAPLSAESGKVRTGQELGRPAWKKPWSSSCGAAGGSSRIRQLERIDAGVRRAWRTGTSIRHNRRETPPAITTTSGDYPCHHQPSAIISTTP